jgi:hypothetical protein
VAEQSHIDYIIGVFRRNGINDEFEGCNEYISILGMHIEHEAVDSSNIDGLRRSDFKKGSLGWLKTLRRS